MMRPRMRPTALLGATCALLLASTAAAQEVDAERERRARQHYEAGTAYFDTGDYESALREFRQAHAESPHGELLYNVYLCQERIGNLREAVEALEAFLETPNVPRREILERRLVYLRERAARGDTRIAAEDAAEGRPAPVDEVSPSTDPAASVTQPPRASTSTSGGPSPLAIAGFAVAAAGLVTFGVAGGITLAEDARLRDECAPGCPPSEVDTITASAIAADVGAGVALLGAVLGVIGLVIGGAETPSAEGGGVALRLRGLALEGAF